MSKLNLRESFDNQRTPEEIARIVVFRLVSDRELKAFVKAVASERPEAIKKALEEPMQTAVNMIDSVVWDVPFFTSVQGEVTRLLLRNLAKTQGMHERM